MLRHGAPQLASELKNAAARARTELPHATIDGIDWVWPAGDVPTSPQHAQDDRVRLLAPFDPVVWDRSRFELFFGWAYRFEAYTPAAKRVRGYYALPLLFRGNVIGWANVSFVAGKLDADLGYVTGRAPRDRVFHRELEAELADMLVFLSPR